MRVGWSTDFIVVDGDAPALEGLPRIDAAKALWVVIACRDFRCYVLSRDEVFERLRATRIPYHPTSKRRLLEVLDLHETGVSTPVDRPSQVAPPDLSWRPGETAPSIWRFVETGGSIGQVLAIGGTDVAARATTQARPPERSPEFTGHPPRGTFDLPTAGAPPGGDRLVRGKGNGVPRMRGAAPQGGPEPAPVGATPPAQPGPAGAVADDEGTSPVRYPSIEPETPLEPGSRVTLTIDLLRDASATTSGGPLELGEQPAAWSSLELGITLVSSAIDFDDSGRARVTIRRNDSSLPARIGGRVRADVARGSTIEVHAQFWDGTRCSGSAVRRLAVAVKNRADSAAATPPANGAIRCEPDAEPPDLTVYITLFDPEAPGRMHWRMVAEPFDGLPPKLDGMINVGKDPAEEAKVLFKQFAQLERGKHRSQIEGFGEELWARAPEAFRAVYWALHDHHQRPLTIQFVSDDPHLPWELMRPHRDGETHPPLALRHAVGRWIGQWHGYMRNHLNPGRIVTIAPRYKSASLRLSLAETTAESLVQKFGARPVAGTLQAMRGLLETPPEEAVALLYFTGHGVFNGEAAAASALKLEDGTLAVRDVARREVMLGERHGTLVFFNACEVGATGSALGTVGGWANAILGRRFRAFIAPLWAIDEEDAAQATAELMTRIVSEGEPVGAALRDLRAKHGDVSPTFFSYLLYGDVTARLPKG